MKIAIGADIYGFSLKEAVKQHLQTKGIEITDLGINQAEADTPYYQIATQVASLVAKQVVDRGILICGTGMGMAIIANKYPGVYAAVCEHIEAAEKSRSINNANVLTMGGFFTTPETAEKIVDVWLNTHFTQGWDATIQAWLENSLKGINQIEIKQFKDTNFFTSQLKILNNTLAIFDSLLNVEGFDAFLADMLESITQKIGELLNADRTSILLLDKERHELYSLIAKNDKGEKFELRFPAHLGIPGEVATFKKVVNIPYDFYNDPRSENAKKVDLKTGYRTYTMLAMPLIKEETEELVAVVQLINKLKSHHEHYSTLAEKIDDHGFTEDDEQAFREFAPSICLILESSQSFYLATQKQRASSVLMNAIQSLFKGGLDLEDILKRVMDQAKDLMQADRSVLWLIDYEKDQLWTKITINDELKEIRIPRTAGFSGVVAQSGAPLIIPFDLYDDTRSETSKKIDQTTGYRTCSMLCMPVFNGDGQLIGVTLLVNKKRPGDYPPYDKANWPEAPEQWKASFNRSDQDLMEAFNIQVGIALQNAKLFAEVQQKNKMQEDMLRSLTS